MPHVESLSLFKAEEPQEETEVLSTLGLTCINASQPQIVQQDASIPDSLTTPTDNYPIQNFRDNALPSIEPKEQISIISTNPPPPLTQPSNVLEVAGSTIGLRSTVTLSKATSESTDHPSTIVPNPILKGEQDEDEEMPLIDVDSDSEDEVTD